MDRKLKDYYETIWRLGDGVQFNGWWIWISGDGPIQADKQIDKTYHTIKGYDSRVWGWQLPDLLYYLDNKDE